MITETVSVYEAFTLYMRTAAEKGLEEAEDLLPEPPEKEGQTERDIFFRQCLAFINQVRECSSLLKNLAAGDLSIEVDHANRIAVPIQQLQKTLKELTRQTELIAEGDLDQRFQFLGDFSMTFNLLIKKLRIRSELEHKIAANESRLKTITKVMGDGVIVTDHHGLITFCNPEACRILGRDQDELLRSSFHQSVHRQNEDGSDITEMDKFTESALSTKKIYRSDTVSFTKRDGAILPVAISCSPIIDGDKATGTVTSFRDISKQKEYLESLVYINSILKKQAMTDTLTELYNRQYFNDRLRQELEGCKRYMNNVSLIMFDIDRFKRINDTFGHLTGDSVIKEVSRLILANVRASDIFARWGGEEFVILAIQIGKESAIILAEKLRSLLETHNFSITHQVTCSFGVTQYKESESSGDFINRADMALYEAKQAGRNRVVAL